MGLRSVNALVLGIVVLVMASACLSHAPSTPSQTSTSSPPKTSPTASPRSFIDIKPPEILDFNWTPTKVVWDKIYDIEVNFTVKDDKTPVKYAELRFIPVEYKYFITKYGMRPEDYPKVFPPDKERVYVLKPIDGKFDELKEEFSVDIKNITGGREYKIVAVVKDAAGNERTVEIKTPYIRQFENFGRQLYEKGIIVSAVYCGWNFDVIPMKNDEPLLGRYDAMDDIVQWKHIDWVTGYGINTFWIGIYPHEYEVAKKFLLKNGIKVGIITGSDDPRFIKGGKDIPEWAIDLKDERNSRILLENMEKIIELSSFPNYLRIHGRPAIFIYDESAFFNQENTYSKFVKDVQSKIGIRPFIIADCIPRIPTTPEDEYFNYLFFEYRKEGLQLVDAFTGWIAFFEPDSKNEDIAKNFENYYSTHLKVWKSFTHEMNKYFVPSVVPGFDNSYSWGGPDITILPRTPEKFEKRLEISMEFLNDGILRIDTFNDFGEWSNIEPTSEEGFAYLNVLKQVLEEYLENITSPKPQILDFNWTPTKVVWDKVYDLKVSFKVSYPPDEISSVKLIFRPEDYSYFITEYGMRREDYYKVFPNDSRVYELKPVDGVLDESLEEFEVNITNITGGAEYWIIIQVQTKNGRTIEHKTKTPYIRQYENNAKKDNLTIMALYLLWWGKDNNWDEYTGSDFSLLGQYSSMDMIVINKHVDWATGYGIDVFLINWPGSGGYQDHALKEYFLKSDLVAKGDIKFAILYETIWRLVDSHPGWSLSDERNIEILTSDFEYLSKNYFQHPAYFRVNSRPFVFIYESKGFFGDINQITILKDMYDLYLVSDHGHPEADPKTIFGGVIWGDVAKRFDAIMDRWGYERYPENDMKRWYEWCNVNGIDFIPSAAVGLSYKNAPWKFDVPEVPRKTELLKGRIQLALKYLDPDIKILFIPEFNNFFENSYLEPSTQDGFKYLTTLKESIG